MIKVLLFLLFIFECALASGVNRYAVIVGANFGGRDRVQLKYAVTDGEMFKNVLSDMGGLEKANLKVLNDPEPNEIVDLLRKINTEVKKDNSGLRTEFIFYYSGHADEKGLLLGDKSLDYKTLKSEIDEIGSEIKIAILDACASGAITRIKGGVRKQSFLAGSQIDLKGYAILTSSSESESSQESDQIGGSYFTHYLVSGLRGAADASNDGKVTLNEAYEYAYQETLLRTSRSKGGVQHPNYDMKLSGSGEIVMTDLRKIDAGVIIPPEMAGRIFIKNSSGQLVAEFAKQKGQKYNLGLTKGNYELVKLEDGMLSHMRFDLKSGQNLKVTQNLLASFTPERTSIRGGNPDSYIRELQTNEVEEEEKVLGFSDILFNKNDKPTVGLQMSFIGNYAHRRHRGWQVSLFTNIAMEEVYTQVTTGVNVAMGDVHGSQISAVANLNGSMFSNSKESDQLVRLNGIQLASSLNYGEEINGVQMSGFGNGAIDVDGLQLTSVFNVTKRISGMQLAGASNIAREVDGMQLTAAANVVGKIKGMQFAVANVADTVRGFQLGIFNYVNHSEGVSLGLFNYVGNGLLAIRYSFDETGMQRFGLINGTSLLYTEYIVGGYNESEYPAFGLGLGSRVYHSENTNVHIGSEIIYVFESPDFEPEDQWDRNQAIITLKSQFGYKPFKDWFEIYVGAKYSLALVHNQGYLLESAWWGKPSGNDKLKHWPGLFAGISLGKI